MVEPVDDPAYWRARLEKCGGELHRAVFNGSIDQFSPLQQAHRLGLLRLDPDHNLLDAGCGYGRLVDLLPDNYRGRYVGVDISPELITLARLLHPGKEFAVADLRRLPYGDGEFHVAVVCSVRPMVIRNLGLEQWNLMEREIRRVTRLEPIYLTFGSWD